MQRLSNWEELLGEYLAGCEGRAFEYGTLDCALFASSAVEAMTGTDPAADFRGQYDSLHGSIRALRQIGNGTLEATFDARFPLIPIGFARRGDLAFVDGSVGVVVGGTAALIGETDTKPGLVYRDRSEWQKAWAVG